MWVGAADTGIATSRVQDGKMVSSSKGKREVLLIVKHCRKLGTPAAKDTFDAKNREGSQRVGRHEERCIRKGRQWFRRATEIIHKGK